MDITLSYQELIEFLEKQNKAFSGMLIVNDDNGEIMIDLCADVDMLKGIRYSR